MRIVFIGASRLTLHTTRLLLEDGHDVVVVEHDAETATALSDELACGVIHGDGGSPALLREANPTNSDYLFCLTTNDQTNIIASLVGRSLGFKHVVTQIDNPEFEHICLELGLENTSSRSGLSVTTYKPWCKARPRCRFPRYLKTMQQCFLLVLSMQTCIQLWTQT